MSKIRFGTKRLKQSFLFVIEDLFDSDQLHEDFFDSDSSLLSSFDDLSEYES